MAKDKEWSKFEVRPQISYATEVPTQKEFVASPPAAAAAEPPPAEKCAVWIVHGMGQQVPYATLDELNQGICIGAAAEGITVSAPAFREVKVGNTILQRVEITLSKDAEQKELHLYESYWAPKTEGVVRLKSVIGFLWDGGSRGLVNWKSGFHRALFSLVVPFKLSWRTPVYLLFTLAVLAALMTINAIIVATGASWAGIGNLSAKINAGAIPPITTVAGIGAAAGITFGVVLFLAQLMRPARPEPNATDSSKKRYHSFAVTLQYLSWIALIFTALTIIVTAVILAVILWVKQIPVWALDPFQPWIQLIVNLSVFSSLLLVLIALWRKRARTSHGNTPREGVGRQAICLLAFLVHILGLAGIIAVTLCAGWTFVCTPEASRAGGVFDCLASGFAECIRKLGCWMCLRNFFVSLFTSSLWVWPFLAILSAAVRNLLVQYVGDVTAYVASNKIDKYDEVRKAIKALAKESASAVYSLRSPGGGFEYSKIAVVGHSLGSVIAYDTLNRLIADDSLAGCSSKVVDRTRLFLTFGSPLDKTAFFFSVMGRDTLHVREQLAAVVQPMIEDRSVREKIPWVNVFSRNDIICGSLDFYDLPPNTPPNIPPVRAVENVKDPDALIPLAAHVEYWQNSTVWRELLKKL